MHEHDEDYFKSLGTEEESIYLEAPPPPPLLQKSKVIVNYILTLTLKKAGELNLIPTLVFWKKGKTLILCYF